MMKKAFEERERAKIEHKQQLERQQEQARVKMLEKNRKQAENYENYYNTVLMADKLKHENQKIEQERRRRQAQRKIEQAQFEKQKKGYEMKKKMDMLI